MRPYPLLSLDLATLAVAGQPGERGGASVAFDFAQAAVDAVAQRRVTIAGLSGPTVAARSSSMAGTALDEARQLIDPVADSSLASDRRSAAKLRNLERKVQRIQEHLHPGQKQQFIANLIAATASRVLSADGPEAASLFPEASKQNVASLGRRLDREVQWISRRLSQEIGKVFSSGQVVPISDPTLSLDPATLAVSVQPGDGDTSVAFDFVQAAVDAVALGGVTIAGLSGPTVAARFYAMTGTALYEAWQLIDPVADSSLASDRRSAAKLRNLERKVQRIQEHLHPGQQQQFITNLIAATANRVLSAEAPEAASLFAEASKQNVVSLGRRLDSMVWSISHSLSREIGKVFASDGALEGATAPYTPVNSNPENVIVLDRWTPEYRLSDDPESGLQTYLTPGWGDVRAFIDSDRLDAFISTMKVPEPFLLDPGATADLEARTITTSDGQVVPISRAAVGSLINPAFISQTERVIDISAGLTEEGKFVAEFWEDGGGTPFPPGTWMIFGQYAAEKESLSLGDEVKLYYTLGHAMQSAAVATWKQKLDTNYARPERVVRELSELGLLGDEKDVDPVTGISRFEAYSRDTYQTEMIDGTTWETYQNPAGGYNPPFAEYPSGHSTFSAAGGTVLALFTGDDFGGSVTGRGVFEPSTENEVVTLEWDTWQEAAEEAGFSRLYGGIHFDDGNLEGQELGALIGAATFETAAQLWT